eukprot:c9956_g1_i1 orf=329-688(-)
MAHDKVHLIKSRSVWDEKLAEGDLENKVVVVDFTATWCGPCKFIAPFFADLSEKYPNLIFLKVDVDEMNDISTEFEVRAMPTFLFIEKKRTVDKIVGANKHELEVKVKHFAEKCAPVVA